MAAAVMSTAQRQKFKDTQDIDLAYSVPGPRPVPLQRLPAARHDRPGAARHPDRRPDDRRARPAARAEADRRGGARPRARHRDHRQRQEHHARGAGGSRERHAVGPRDDDRGSDRVPPPRQPRRSSASARWRSTRARSRTRCAARSGRIPTSSSSARCATSRRSRRRSSPPETGHLVFSALHTLDAVETIDAHHRAVPATPAGAGARAAGERAEGRRSRSGCCRAPTARAARRPSR